MKIVGLLEGMSVEAHAGRPSGVKRLSLGIDARTALGGLLVCIGYYWGTKLGLALTFHPQPVSVMWPPNTILLGALLLSPYRVWWFLIVCAFPAHLITEIQGGVPLGMTLCWFVSNSAEALIGAASTRFLMRSATQFDRMPSILALYGGGAVLGPFLSSFLDSAFVALNNFSALGFWQVWRIRFCSNVFTALTVAPVIVTWGTNRALIFRNVSLRRVSEALGIWLGLLIVTVIVFCWEKSGPTTIPTLLYAPLPLLIWIAVRFGVTGTSTGILLVAVLAIWGVVHGRGPFASNAPEQNALSIQVFFVVVSVALMFLATSIAERARIEERFSKAFRSSPDAMIISRLKDGSILEVNDRWEKFFGYGREETVGREISSLNIYVSEADRERLLTEMLAEMNLPEMELCLRVRTGELRNTVISAKSDEIGGEQCWILIIRDITDKKRAEEAQQSLAHALRLAAVGELTAMVAHEINQPLGAILGNADAVEILLGAERPPLDEIRQIISDIKKSERRADAAIRRMRELLRKREIQLEALDLNEAVLEVIELVAGDAHRRQVQLQTKLVANLPPALGDRIHLQQVLLNLILNGMDAMAGNTMSRRQLTVQTKQNGEGALEVRVADQGHGIRPDDMAHIFDSFFTTKKDGMGLGLSIARSIVEAHHGRIWAENDPSGGAVFHFTLKPTKDSGYVGILDKTNA